MLPPHPFSRLARNRAALARASGSQRGRLSCGVITFDSYGHVGARPYSVGVHPQRRAPVKMEDVTLIVRPKGNWSAYRAFTEEQRAEAEAHAREHGAVVETLPLP